MTYNSRLAVIAGAAKPLSGTAFQGTAAFLFSPSRI
jgi:hypothetical protein